MSMVNTEVCRHHWLLGEPQRGIVPGVCKLCGSRREYPARLEETDRFFDHEELLQRTEALQTIYQPPAEEQQS